VGPWAWARTVAKAVGEAKLVEVETRGLETKATADTDLIRTAAAILTPATEAYHLHLSLKDVDQHGNEMIDQILDCLQDRHRLPATSLLTMGADLTGVMGTDLDLVI
jgi:hypothetical protein